MGRLRLGSRKSAQRTWREALADFEQAARDSDREWSADKENLNALETLKLAKSWANFSRENLGDRPPASRLRETGYARAAAVLQSHAQLVGLDQDWRNRADAMQSVGSPIPSRLDATGKALELSRRLMAAYGTWDKNDSKDAQVILSMLAHNMVQVYYDPLIHGTHDLQELANTYFHITLARTRLQHSLLLHYIPLYFPEFGKYLGRDPFGVVYPLFAPLSHSSRFRAVTQDAFTEEAWTLVGKKVEKRWKIAEFYSMAAQSIGLPVALDSPAIDMFRLQLRRYQDLNEHRESLDAKAQSLLAEDKDFQRLQTLPGIGAIMALTIMAEAGDLRRFGHHRQFLSYCGLDLCKTQSGQSRSRETLSKRGNHRLRMVFWMAGLRAVHMRENAFRDKYERYLSENPLDADRKRKALTAVAAKMARVVYAVIKTGTDYERFFEQRLPSGSIPLARAVEAT